MKAKRIKKLLLSLAALTICVPVLNSQEARADSVTPTVIYSAVEGGNVEIRLDKAIYPITETSGRQWYVDDVKFTPDNAIYTDISKNDSARLKIKNLSLLNNGQDYTVKDITSPKPSGEIISGQRARIYVVSLETVKEFPLSVKAVSDKSVGDKVYASNLALSIGGSSFPNFQSLRFLEDGELKTYIKVKKGENTYDVIETKTGTAVTVTIVGLTDEDPPRINSLLIDNNLSNTFALEKTIKAVASDKEGLPSEPYLWEEDEEMAKYIKEKVMDGEKSEDLIGLTWTKDNSHKVTFNGTVTLFVRDKAGNIAYKDITVSKISTSVPVVYYATLEKDDNAYLNVYAEDPDEQPLIYKLNDGEWQTSSKLYNVKEGTNIIYVKNEAGKEATISKYVYLSVYTGKDSELSPEYLYNHINISPISWTNGKVTLTLQVSDSLREKLASIPYSVNGTTFSTTAFYEASVQGEIVTFTVKDIYGNLHSSKPYTVNNIDTEIPSVSLSESGGVVTVAAQDNLSGISKIAVSGRGLNSYAIRQNSTAGSLSDIITYDTKDNGSYRFTVTDFAGNETNASISVTGNEIEYSADYRSGSSYSSGTNRTTVSASGSTQGSAASAGTTTSAGVNGAATGRTTVSANSEGSATQENGNTENPTVVTAEGSKNHYATTQSDAGHTEEPEEKEAELIEIKKESDKNTTGSDTAKKIEQPPLDTSASDTLNKMVWILIPVSILGAIAVVIIVNKRR